MPKKVILETPDGHSIKVENWQSRRSPDDTLFGTMLPPGGYEEMKRRREAADESTHDESAHDGAPSPDARDASASGTRSTGTRSSGSASHVSSPKDTPPEDTPASDGPVRPPRTKRPPREDAPSGFAAPAEASDAAAPSRRHRRRKKADSSFVTEVGASVEVLTPKQLAALAGQLLGREMDSLEHMPKDDLVDLVRRVARMKRVKIRINIDDGRA